VITPAEFKPVVREHQVMVFRSLTRLLGSREQVEDLAQEVFLRLYRGMQQFRGDSLLTTYLYRIILNVAQDEWKRRRCEQTHTSLSEPDAHWEERLASPERDPEQRLSGQQLGSQLNASLAELSEPERAAIILFHQEDCTYEQIALVLGLPIGTVRTHLPPGPAKAQKADAEQDGPMPEDRDQQELSCAALQRLLRSQPQCALCSAHVAHHAACDACAELMVVHGLASAPVPEIPQDFAANLCAGLPVEPVAPPPVRRRISGFTAALAVLAVLTCAASLAFAVAPQLWLPRGTLGVVLEAALVTEVVALALWLGAPRSTR
jgi:RNA polymerase sigma-70 factor (ECF subfamily)